MNHLEIKEFIEDRLDSISDDLFEGSKKTLDPSLDRAKKELQALVYLKQLIEMDQTTDFCAEVSQKLNSLNQSLQSILSELKKTKKDSDSSVEQKSQR